MEIKVNGQAETIEGGSTIGQLLARLGIENRNLAVEYNGDFLEAEAIEQTPLVDGDTLEIVRFVGGG